jgi:hypothetical protein
MIDRRRDLGIVLTFAALITLLSAWKAFTIDETFYLALGRGALADPLRPEAIPMNFSGELRPMGDIQASPISISYPLALGLRLFGDSEWKLRLFFLPFDLLAAWALYLIAARYLKKPLMPVLVAMAGPAYLINMPHLMCERFMAALCFPAILALLKGVEERKPKGYWTSALLCGAALTIKTSAVFIVIFAAAYGLARKVSPRKVAAHALLCALPAALYFAWSHRHAGRGLDQMWGSLAAAPGAPWRAQVHRFRAWLTFLPAGAAAPALWAWTPDFKKPGRAALACLAAAAIPFLPVFDWGPVSNFDRIVAWLLAAGVLRASVILVGPSRGRPLWLIWIGAVMLLQGAVYPTGVLLRYVLFAVPPFVFGLAEVLEDRGLGTRALAASLSATLALSLLLLKVDVHYAAAQREMARFAAENYIARGRKVWFTGHWGLQYYMERAGAVALDKSLGGWSQPKAGDVVILPAVNASMLTTDRPIQAVVREAPIREAVPLRLMSIGDRQAGFYSSVWGFLPYTVSRAPLDRFKVFEIR